MPKFFIEFGVTVYHDEFIEAPNIEAARNVAYALDLNPKFLYERLRPAWGKTAAAIANDFTDVECDTVPDDTEVTIDADMLKTYLSPIELYDYHKACIEPEIKQAIEKGDWLRVSELAAKLAEESPRIREEAHE